MFNLIKKQMTTSDVQFSIPPPHLYIFINFFPYELKNELLFFLWEESLKWKVTAVYINDLSFI